MIYPDGKIDECAFFQGAGAGVAGHPLTRCPHSPRTIKGKSWRAGFEQGREYLEMTQGSTAHAVVYADPEEGS